MALRLSTGLRNAMLDKKAEARSLVTNTTISFSVDGGTSGRGQILDSANGLIGFTLGDMITVSGSTSNNGTFEILSVAADIIEVASSTLTTEASGAQQIILAGAQGGSFVDIFKHCVIDIYSGSQPTNADSGETGTFLLKITQDSGAFVSDVATNGLNFGAVVSGVLAKEPGEVWSGAGVTAGTAGWFRCYDNSYVTGIDDTEVRFDGACATSGAQLNMSNTTIVVGATTTIDSLTLTLPAN